MRRRKKLKGQKYICLKDIINLAIFIPLNKFPTDVIFFSINIKYKCSYVVDVVNFMYRDYVQSV